MASELQRPWRPGSQILAQYVYKSEHHPGKTLERVWEQFYWYGLQHDVEDWCRQWEKCARRKSHKDTAQAPLVSRCPGYPLEKLHSTPWDQCQLLNLVSQVHPGYQRLFTKWKEAFAIPDQEIKTVVRSWWQMSFPDMEPQKRSIQTRDKTWKPSCSRKCVMFNMDKTRTSSYHTENDGMLERMNRTGMQDMLAKYVSDHQCNWDEHLPLVMMAYRSSAHASTQCTPFYLLFGHEVRLPVDVMFGPQPNHNREVSDYVGNLPDTLEEVHKHAREHLSSCPETSAGPSLPANCWRAKLRLVIKT